MTNKILRGTTAKRHATAEALCGDLSGRYCPETERVIDGEQI